MPTAIQLVLKFGSVNTINVDLIHIRCPLGECEFNSHSNGIKCEKALNQLSTGLSAQRDIISKS